MTRRFTTGLLDGSRLRGSTNLSDWVQRADCLQRAELGPVGDFNWLQKELAPPVVRVLTNHPAEEERRRKPEKWVLACEHLTK